MPSFGSSPLVSERASRPEPRGSAEAAPWGTAKHRRLARRQLDAHIGGLRCRMTATRKRRGFPPWPDELSAEVAVEIGDIAERVGFVPNIARWRSTRVIPWDGGRTSTTS